MHHSHSWFPHFKSSVENLPENLYRKTTDRCNRALQLVVLQLEVCNSSLIINDLGVVVTVKTKNLVKVGFPVV